MLPPGTAFPLQLELVVSDPNEEQAQVSLLAAALKGLEEGEIPIGAHRSRGLGACRAKDWRVKRFDLTTRQGWLAWLGSDYERPLPTSIASQAKIDQALKAAFPALPLDTSQSDNRKRLLISATLMLDGGLLVRSPGTDVTAADVTHLTSGGKSVLPGTSLVGVLRARALRIARIVRNGKGDAKEWVDLLFSPHSEGITNPNFQPHASRLRVTEKEIRNGNRLRPNRVKIDRFTGGVVDGALFDEEPVYRGQVEVKMEVRDPKPGETGLLLLLLKDLLTGDLPVGGSSSVGRGVLKGKTDIFMDGKQFILNPEEDADPETAQVLNLKVREFHNT